MKLSLSMALMLLMLSACSWHSSDHFAACQLKQDYEVQFIGHAFGRGAIRFKADSNSTNSIAYEVAVYSSNTSSPDIAITGLAQCLNGVVTGKFGGGNTSKPELSVLGGKFEGVFKHNHIEAPFGRWTISLYDTSKDKNYDLSGFWQESIANTVVSRNE